LFAAMNRIAKLVGLAGARASGETLSCSLSAEGSRQGHFFLRLGLNCTRCISIAPAMLDCGRRLIILPLYRAGWLKRCVFRGAEWI
jgi:hypothetical protein